MKAYMKFACIYCGQHMECDPRFGGRHILCPACLHRIAIPNGSGGNPARRALPALETWDSQISLPRLQTPTRHHNPMLAQRA